MTTFQPRLERLEDRTVPATLPTGFSETTLATTLADPTAMDIAPDGRVFVLEQNGHVRIVNNGTVLPTPFLSLSVDSTGERGLLGIAFDPNFTVDQYVYFYYTTTSGGVAHNRVSRFTAQGDTAVPGSEVVLLDLNNLSATYHNGGAIHFGADGKLYIAVGDNGTGANSQSLGTLFGKMLRINPDGSIPTDNPFYNTATGNNRAIWAIGLRNPFTFAVQPGTGRIFINDVGESTWEEIDEGIPGANYGWPNAEGFSTNPAYTNPLLAYGHGSGTDLGVAIVGGTFYDPPQSQFPANYVGGYFYADLGNNWMRLYDPVSGQSTLFATNLTPLTVDLKVDAAGRLYYLSRGTGATTGTLVRATYGNLTQNQSWVRSLYQDELGRTGTLDELNAWVSQLPALGQAAVARNIAQSHEAHQHLVDTLYSYALGRAAAGGEEQGWVSGLDQGVTVEQVAAGILGSAEFAGRANALEGTSDANTNYVRALYRLLLRRPDSLATSAEVQGWVSQLATLGRSGVALGFLDSTEFRSDVVQTLYGQTSTGPLPFVPDLLKRPMAPTASEVAGWVNSSLDVWGIDVAMAGTFEYAARV
jgi:glucose/arabinose dehydrogenase